MIRTEPQLVQRRECETYHDLISSVHMTRVLTGGPFKITTRLKRAVQLSRQAKETFTN